MEGLKSAINYLKERTILGRVTLRNTVFRKQVWDFEYKTGSWDFIDVSPCTNLTSIVASRLGGGALLDLGCAFGNMIGALDGFDRYHGVDVSSVVIATAAERFAGLTDVTFTCADITKFEPDSRYDVILFSEVLHYLDRRTILRVLKRYRKFLPAKGVLILRFYCIEEQKENVDLIRRHFTVRREVVTDDPESYRSIVMVI